jgi:predicted FMN-binding regulatory protein PaiB
MVNPIATWTDADLQDLIAAYPLAWIVTRGAEPGASLLPLLLDLDPSGRPVSLTGHFPRSNPQFSRRTRERCSCSWGPRATSRRRA